MHKRAEAYTESRPLSGLNILVVDDNTLNQQLTLQLLASQGAIVEVSNGGVKSIEKMLTTKTPFDAVLMDIQMPDMDGYTATRAIRKNSHLKTLPIIAMTANVLAGDKQLCFDAGMTDHIAKPVHLDVLVATLCRHCRCNERVLLRSIDYPDQSNAVLNATSLYTELKSPLNSVVALRRLGGNQDLYHRVLTGFDAECRQTLVSLGALLNNSRYPEAADVLHTFKSTAGLIGAGRLETEAANFELMLRDRKDPATLEAYFSTITLSIAYHNTFVSELLKSKNIGLTQVLDTTPHAPTTTEMWDDLEFTLASSNMEAVAVFERLEHSLGGDTTPTQSKARAAMAKLDFKKALTYVRKMRKEKV